MEMAKVEKILYYDRRYVNKGFFLLPTLILNDLVYVFLHLVIFIFLSSYDPCLDTFLQNWWSIFIQPDLHIKYYIQKRRKILRQ